MGLLKNLFGANASVPTYDVNAAKDMYLWTQNQGRYNVNNGFAGLNWDQDTNTLNTTYSPQMQGVLGNLFGGTNADKQAADSVFNQFADRYEPIFERQTNQTMDRLKNSGIPVDSAAYQKAMQNLSQNQNDARRQAMYQAQQAGQQARTQEIQNNLGIFGAFNPLNGYTGSSVQGNTSIYDNQFANQVAQAQANAANKSAMAGGIMNMIQAGAGLMLSDARIKENLRPVGQLFNGLTVYAFNFPGDETTRLGLVAQEVRELIPEAVQETAEGLLAVDYALASQFEEAAEEENQLQEGAHQ